MFVSKFKRQLQPSWAPITCLLGNNRLVLFIRCAFLLSWPSNYPRAKKENMRTLNNTTVSSDSSMMLPGCREEKRREEKGKKLVTSLHPIRLPSLQLPSWLNRMMDCCLLRGRSFLVSLAKAKLLLKTVLSKNNFFFVSSG